MWHCVADVSQRLFRSYWGIIAYTPHPATAGYCLPFTTYRSHRILSKSGYLPCDGFPSSWCQVRIPWFFTAFQNLQITLWLVGYDGFCQKHETLCVGCHKYFTIAGLLGGVWRPAASSSHSAVRATTAKIPIFLNESPFSYSFLWDFAVKSMRNGANRSQKQSIA